MQVDANNITLLQPHHLWPLPSSCSRHLLAALPPAAEAPLDAVVGALEAGLCQRLHALTALALLISAASVGGTLASGEARLQAGAGGHSWAGEGGGLRNACVCKVECAGYHAASWPRQ